MNMERKNKKVKMAIIELEDLENDVEKRIFLV